MQYAARLYFRNPYPTSVVCLRGASATHACASSLCGSRYRIAAHHTNQLVASESAPSVNVRGETINLAAFAVKERSLAAASSQSVIARMALTSAATPLRRTCSLSALERVLEGGIRYRASTYAASEPADGPSEKALLPSPGWATTLGATAAAAAVHCTGC